MNGDLSPRVLPVETHAAIGAAWEAVPDDLPEDIPEIADAIHILVKQRDTTRESLADADAVAKVIRADLVAAQNKAVQLRHELANMTEARDQVVRNWELVKSQRDAAEALQDGTAGGALSALRQYIEHVYDVDGQVSFQRILGWLDRAVEDSSSQ